MSGGWPSPEAAELAEWIRVRTGLTFPSGRREQAAASMVMALGDACDVVGTVARLERDPKALDELIAELTIGETYFFRHREQFEVIRSSVLPQLRREQRAPLRVWSAGCATGEEAYSLAILLREESAPTGKIIGTDLSRARLAVARRGRYRKWSFRGVPEETIARYFEAVGKWYQISAEMRAAVEFRYLNLVEDRYPSATAGIWGMDLILCRNVLIYLDRDSVARVARQLVDSLSEHGWLFLGASDPSIIDLAPVDVMVTDAGLVYRRVSSPGAVDLRASIVAARETKPAVPEDRPAAAPEPEAPAAAVPTPMQETKGRGDPSLTDPDELARLYWEQLYDDVAAGAARLLNSDASSERVHVLLVRSLANRGDTDAAGPGTVQRLCALAGQRLKERTVDLLEASRLEERNRPSSERSAAHDEGSREHRLVGGVVHRFEPSDEVVARTDHHFIARPHRFGDGNVRVDRDGAPPAHELVRVADGPLPSRATLRRASVRRVRRRRRGLREPW